MLPLLCEAYSECNRLDLREMDQILDPVCSLCRDYERVGFVAGIKIGIFLAREVE